MSLRLLPNPQFPITPQQVAPLMSGIVQMNLVDAGITERQQFALGINFHIHDLLAKSRGAIDYRSKDGHGRLMQDAVTFSSGAPIVTRLGDLAAAHLTVDFNDTALRLRNAGYPALPDNVADLLRMCSDLAIFSPAEEKRVLLLLDWLSKKPI